MGDQCCGRDWACRIDGAGDLESVSRRPSVSDALDEVFHLLCDRRRRYLLYFLFVMDGTVAEFEEVAEAVATYEAAGEGDDQPTEETVEIELRHHHLPKLAEADVVDYDRRQGTVRFEGHPGIEEWAEHAHYKEME